MTALLVLRFVEYAGAAILFGAPLFLLYAPLAGRPPGLDRLILCAAALLVLAAPLHFLVQTAGLAGGFTLDPATLKAAFLEMDFGKASLVRGLAALAALFLHKRKGAVAALGAIAAASFAWMGHGAATEGALGWIHLTADILHVLAASAWISALTVFALCLMKVETAPSGRVLQDFSRFGILFVAVLLATGIINSVFMLGTISALWRSFYGQLLCLKIILFAAMIALAARNRALARIPDGDVTAIRPSLVAETVLGFLVLALVAGLGMLQPPAP
jgi:putative copper resistance protein D